ncbi:hypothetical protein ABIB62_004310 [Mucilaginibacter sp. UYP25]|uniref:hypothetical protein n=1 Tax=unclassified Mucilaginibacter TaxID=2617802 RepID=UPI00339AA8CE
MGLHRTDKCFFTGLDVQNIEGDDFRDAYEYLVSFEIYRILIRLPFEAKNWAINNLFFKENKYLFEGLLYNNKWFDNQQQLITIEKLKELLTLHTFPTTPKDKSDSVFQEYLKLQREDGQLVQICNSIPWKRLYLKSNAEMIYYTEYLQQQGLIDAKIRSVSDGSKLIEQFNITVKGLNYGILLQTEGDKSNLCFIAMAFKDETKTIRIAIKEALKETGFQPILIDEQNINSDRTINDEIIASLKRCKFCIADFSYHSNGVYFESGFALGQGKKVIYTCQAEEFAKAHFDIRPLQHIIYDTPGKLKKDLVHKIEAWIK